VREKLKAEREEALALEQSELVKLLETRTEKVLPLLKCAQGLPPLPETRTEKILPHFLEMRTEMVLSPLLETRTEKVLPLLRRVQRRYYPLSLKRA
jgi:hypothetical protein